MNSETKFLQLFEIASNHWGSGAVLKGLIKHFSIGGYGDLITNIINPLMRDGTLPIRANKLSLDELSFTLSVWIEDDEIKPKQWSAYKPH
ncbi:Uncharacterised protein [uncultured archaeon]|nr:Uncharacterised protein [uncultured archaeon]